MRRLLGTRTYRVIPVLTTTLAGITLSSCGGDGSPTDPGGNQSGTGSIQVSATTTNNLDPDGYGVSVDGTGEGTVAVNGSVTINGIAAGSRTVRLEGIAPNCAADGGDSRTVSVTQNATATVSFDVACTDPPDGRIYFASELGLGITALSVMDTDGSGVLTLAGWDVRGRIDVSPDGERLALDVMGESGWELFLASKDGSGLERILSAADAYEGRPSWSPDGETIAFAAGPENLQISTVGLDGSNPTVLTDHPEHWSYWPDWSPDGSRIAFHRSTAWASYDSDNRIHVMNADGTGVTALTEPAPLAEAACWGQGLPMWWDYYPQWSPDGTRILFLREFNCDESSSGYTAIYVMNQDGTEQTELVRNANAWAASWSPDGSRVVVITEDWDIMVMDSDGTNQHVIREAQEGEVFLAVAWGA